MIASRLVQLTLCAPAVFAALLCAPAAGAQAAASPSPRNANYTVEVRLDPAARTLAGEQVLEWRNDTPVAAAELRFHLYWNAWRNDRSTWMKEDSLRPQPRGAARKKRAGDWAYLEVRSSKVLAYGPFPEADRTRQMRFASPDDSNPDDRTVLVVPLARPVGPGETIRVEMTWDAKIPRTFARTGFRGNYFFFAHWFPKIGVFQSDGSWNCHQFHAATEFFSDYGVYDVQMTVPRGWTLGATGVRLGVTDNADGTSTHRYQQADVHEFAWTTSPDYREATRRFTHPELPAVEMRLLYQPEHSGQVDRHFRATEAALEHYGLWFGPYPYGQVTIVDPAYQSGAGGMEYPTFFTAGTRYWNPFGAGSPEGVTIHEAGHQFWYGIVGNDEFNHAWIDEGLNTYSEERVQEVVWGDTAWAHSRRFFQGFLPVLRRDIREDLVVRLGMNRYRRAARRDIPATPTYLYHPETASAISYSKTALWLLTLERTLGWETMQRVMSTFFERWKFRHPRPEDFFAVANEVSGRDLAPFFEQVFYKAAVFDFGVESVESRAVRVTGYVEREGQLAFVEGQPPGGPGAETLYETRVVVRRFGDGVLPVEVLLRFEDGSEVRELWNANEPWKLYTVVKPVRLEYAFVDPERKIALDTNYTNNSRRLGARSRFPAAKWASKWMFWLQDFLQTLSFLI